MSRDAGSRGEYALFKMLKFYEKTGARFLFNCYLPRGNCRTTEVDVVMIHHSGVYVFENKNYSGWIFGDPDSQKWTQTLPQGRGYESHKEHFQNPIYQNNLHIRCMSKLLQNHYPLRSVVVFSNHCDLKTMSPHIGDDYSIVYMCNVSRVIKHFSLSCASCLSENDIEEVYNTLYPFSQVSDDIKNEHRYSIRKSL